MIVFTECESFRIKERYGCQTILPDCLPITYMYRSDMHGVMNNLCFFAICRYDAHDCGRLQKKIAPAENVPRGISKLPINC